MSLIIIPIIHTLVSSRFLSAPSPLIINNTTSQASFSFSAAVQNDTPITIKAFDNEVVINADCNTHQSDPLGIRMCNRILGNVNTDIRCNYSQPYHIDCNVTMNLSSINKNTRNVYPITFLLGTEDSHQTGMISKGIRIVNLSNLCVCVNMRILMHQNNVCIDSYRDFPPLQ